MSFVKAIMEARKETETIVEGRLLKFLSHTEEQQTDTMFRASGIYYMCPRAEVLRSLIPKKDTISPALRAKFDIGHAMHHWYQNKYLGPMGILRGNWKCVVCGEVVKDSLLPKTNCSNCDARRYEYEEMYFVNTEWSISGHLDGILDIKGKEWLMDLKTIDPSMFKSLKAPLPAAEYQVQVYMWLCGLPIQQGVVVYIDKSANDVTPIKEFKIEYSEPTINEVKGKITSYKLSMANRTLPMRSCESCTNRKARSCPYSDECFNDDKCNALVSAWKDSSEK